MLQLFFHQPGQVLKRQQWSSYQRVSSDFGLTVSIVKTKSMVTGRLIEESDCEPIELEGGSIDIADKFPYLGSLVDNSGRSTVDVEWSGSSIKSFWSLRPEEGRLS